MKCEEQERQRSELYNEIDTMVEQKTSFFAHVAPMKLTYLLMRGVPGTKQNCVLGSGLGL